MLRIESTSGAESGSAFCDVVGASSWVFQGDRGVLLFSATPKAVVLEMLHPCGQAAVRVCSSGLAVVNAVAMF